MASPKVIACLLLLCAVNTALSEESNTTRHCTGECQQQDVYAKMPFIMRLKEKDHEECVKEMKCPTLAQAMEYTPCDDGKAGEYECKNVDLLSFVPLANLGCGGDANDIWGWTDPETNREYAILGCVDGTSFVDVTTPSKPIVLGFLRTQTYSSLWRDIKVYSNHAFIISEASNHGMQVFDLTQLRNLKPSISGVNVLKQTAYYDELGSSHNIVSNEDTGFMYVVGSRTCNSGLHVVNVRDPTNPQFAGCFGDDGYVHDAQCVIYRGPHERYTDQEICFCYNEDSLTIVNVEDKSNMEVLSRVPYKNSFYTHQGWLLEEQTFLLLNDELDELYGPTPNTRSMIWNVENLEDPFLVDSFYSEKQATDHNLYIKGNLAYETNYCAGLRILDVTKMNEGALKEVAYFDVAPDCNSPGFKGSWSNYPYFKSGTIVVSSIERGLFVLEYTDANNEAE